MADLFYTAKKVLKHVVETKSLPDVALLTLLISQTLGYAILAGACVTKLPQILLIWQARTAEGLSVEMFEIETYTLLVSALYGYTQKLPFNTYGESLILAIQNAVILALVYGYSRAPGVRRTAVAGAYVALVVGVLQGHIPPQTMTTFAEANTVVVMMSRVPQVFKNFAARSTGALSGITTAINVVGCCLRLYTTAQAGGGGAMMRGYVASLLINATLLLQVLLYRRNTAVQMQARRDKAAAAAARAQEGASSKKEQ